MNYTVRPGDTLHGIAARFHTTVQDIMRLNGITDPNMIHVGQILRIPAAPGMFPGPGAAGMPGMPGMPGFHGGTLNQRVARLEQGYAYFSPIITDLIRRVDRLERRVRRLQGR
ncbi:LysM peptidoglycan-binding domain-containing protein [Aneurinibacillus terranovensis]|uniref:LysM peptidoglycan-binding domain-containing protein n=1 Tax=Aneurinibacillus terranovensis TaxID=278991 RepID=UPI00041A9E13|nr:LysM peptidoglycan-binding domain-containing protein [Aneurinibacillus terranovensis]